MVIVLKQHLHVYCTAAMFTVSVLTVTAERTKQKKLVVYAIAG
jgi:hypothetical protein